MSLADDARIEAELLRERVKAGRLDNAPRGVEPVKPSVCEYCGEKTYGILHEVPDNDSDVGYHGTYLMCDVCWRRINETEGHAA